MAGPQTDPKKQKPDKDKREHYDPSQVEATRSRMQGLGVGASDRDRQRDPTRADSTEKRG